MIIRRKQMESFTNQMRRQFEQRMGHHLRAKFPRETTSLDERTLEHLTISGIRRAERYGINFEDDIQRYLEYMMVLSHDFDTNPRTAWAGNILRRRDIDGAQKIDVIDSVYLFARS
jgi:hypothetical protein